MHEDDVESIPNRALVFIGGDPPRAGEVGAIEGLAATDPGTVVVAVDSGLHTAAALGIVVHHVVGDMDSVDPDLLHQTRAAGATIHAHPADKDATDLELALDLVVDLLGSAPTLAHPDADADADVRRPSILVVGGGGGRLDHLLADLLMLTAPRLAACDVRARFGAAAVSVARPGIPTAVQGEPHDQVSLLPLHGEAHGVTTTGLRWPLLDAFLAPGTSRAVSNELVDHEAHVALALGVLAVVQPGTRGAEIAPRPGTYDPTPTDPTPAEPASSGPAPTGPAPSGPAPTEPAPAEPAPTEPAPTEPAPTEPQESPR